MDRRRQSYIPPTSSGENNIQIMSVRVGTNYECEGGIGKSVLRITVWHHEACRVITYYDPEERIFLYHPNMDNGFSFLLTINYCILCLKKGSQNFLNTSRCHMT